ncbi:MAG: hypothetical protein AAF754_10480, partial [Pseudomonadota bacterium]
MPQQRGPGGGRARVARWLSFALSFVILIGLTAPVQADEILTLDKTPKSLFFAGRCLAPVLLREEINTKDLREMPTQFAVPHLYGKSGKVWHGEDDTIVLVQLDEGASCGINVFDEDLPEVEE